MRSARLRRPAPALSAPLEIGESPKPIPEAGEALLRVSACAVCRTDLQLAEGDVPLHRQPVVPGHQVVGRVEAVGADVDSVAIGDRVGAYWLASTCGECKFCRSSRENLCAKAEFTGWDRDGGYAEWMVARAEYLVRIPDSFDDLDAAPLLCGGVIGYRALRVSGIEPGGRLGLYGFGASALTTIQVATHWGCQVGVCTRSEAEQQRARELGAAWAGGYDERPPFLLDAAITFAPVGAVIPPAVEALDRGGTVAINAIHLDHIPEFPYEPLWHERSITSVANVTRQDAEEFIALAAEIPIRTEREEHPLSDANLALQRVADGSVNVAAVLIP